jgi:hypothetical protein
MVYIFISDRAAEVINQGGRGGPEGLLFFIKGNYAGKKAFPYL